MTCVDFKVASLLLDQAFKESKFFDDEIGQTITWILKGTHKTYRYVLVTALLAKAAKNEINPLYLQKGDGKDGKYDARSLCHKVIVPFETIKLPGCLGGSNEPFLNKPARFLKLDRTNAVRSGNDKVTLMKLIQVLNQITDSSIAYKYLRSALSVMKDKNAEYISKYSIGDALIDISDFSQVVLDYVYKLTDYTIEGEVSPLIVAQLEQMYLGRDFKVVPHKVNQSGSSSKEVGDIDVFNNEKELVYSIEVKDKDFSKQDVAHAIAKFRKAELDNSLFIYGKKVKFDEDEVFGLLREIGREGHYCCLISVLNYAKLRIKDLKTLTVRDFVDGLLQFAKAINAKDDTVTIIKDIASKIF